MHIIKAIYKKNIHHFHLLIQYVNYNVIKSISRELRSCNKI